MNDLASEKELFETEKKRWVQFWQEISDLHDGWVSPWLNTRFADGTDLHDGNPIFSAACLPKQIGIRIITYTENVENKFDSWQDTFDDPSGPIKELVISYHYSAYEFAEKFLRNWIANNEQSHSRHS